MSSANSWQCSFPTSLEAVVGFRYFQAIHSEIIHEHQRERATALKRVPACSICVAKRVLQRILEIWGRAYRLGICCTGRRKLLHFSRSAMEYQARLTDGFPADEVWACTRWPVASRPVPEKDFSNDSARPFHSWAIAHMDETAL